MFRTWQGYTEKLEEADAKKAKEKENFARFGVRQRGKSGLKKFYDLVKLKGRNVA